MLVTLVTLQDWQANFDAQYRSICGGGSSEVGPQTRLIFHAHSDRLLALQPVCDQLRHLFHQAQEQQSTSLITSLTSRMSLMSASTGPATHLFRSVTQRSAWQRRRSPVPRLQLCHHARPSAISRKLARTTCPALRLPTCNGYHCDCPRYDRLLIDLRAVIPSPCGNCGEPA